MYVEGSVCWKDTKGEEGPKESTADVLLRASRLEAVGPSGQWGEAAWGIRRC